MIDAPNAPRTADLTPPKLRKLSTAELGVELEAHREWLDSGGMKGHRAKLEGTDLRGVNFRDIDLRGARLRDANLRHADLAGANLKGADLVRVKFQDANLRECTLRECNLQDANLSGVRGLARGQLTATNVAGAVLPEAIARFDGVLRVEAAAGIARTIFLLVLLGCLYAFATIVSTTDASLLADSASALLPNVDTPIPTSAFYFGAPVLLLGVYVYLHLNLDGLWEDLGSLPSVFPDGAPLNKTAYPWLLIRSFTDRQGLSSARSFMLPKLIIIFLVWCLVPVTLLLFWARYLPKHEWIGTGLHMALLLVSIGFGVRSYRLAALNIRGLANPSFQWTRPWLDVRTYRVFALLVIGVVLGGLSSGAIHGVRTSDPVRYDIRTWVPLAFEFVGFSTFANLRNADVSIKPSTWKGKDEDISLVKGAKLAGRRLQYAEAEGAFLVKADLREANLSGADLFEAELQFADLWRAALPGATLVAAKLQEAKLVGADLQGADLDRANLRMADLGGANLENAVLWNATLEEAILDGANLQGSDLTDANLDGAILDGANLQGSNLTDANLNGANLNRANLQGSNLTDANLDGANLNGADFRNAILLDAKLRGAKMMRVRNLTQFQLDQACGDENTELPNKMKIKICPADKNVE